MFLGLAIALASLPGYTSATIPAGWAAMSIFLPLTLWGRVQWTFLHNIFLAFLAFAILSFLWTSSWEDGVFRIWQFILIFLAFNYGASTERLDEVIFGIAIGCAISSLISILQFFHIDPVLRLSADYSAGLFYNHAVAGQTLALVAIACLAFEQLLMAILLLPGIILSYSRGAWVVLAVGLAIARPRTLLLAIVVGLLLVTVSGSSHDLQRMQIWFATVKGLSWFGHGIGSYTTMFVSVPGGAFVYPENVHNDALQLIFEFGWGATILLGLGALCLLHTDRKEWPILAAFVFLGFFAFPLFVPISAFLGAVCAGRIARGGHWFWYDLPNRRYGLPLWTKAWTV